MTSEAKIISNRRNAAKSTGPRTKSGIARARYNAVRYGVFAGAQLLPGEDPKAFDRLRSKLAKKWEPDGPDDDFLIERLASCIWRDRRLKLAQWAALRRTQIKIELCEKAKGKDHWPTEEEIDDALRKSLARDEEQMRRPDQTAVENAGGAGSDLATVEVQAPPLSFVLLKYYGYGSDSKHCAEIDRQVCANNAEIFRLQAALQASLKRRPTIETTS